MSMIVTIDLHVESVDGETGTVTGTRTSRVHSEAGAGLIHDSPPRTSRFALDSLGRDETAGDDETPGELRQDFPESPVNVGTTWDTEHDLAIPGTDGDHARRERVHHTVIEIRGEGDARTLVVEELHSWVDAQGGPVQRPALVSRTEILAADPMIRTYHSQRMEERTSCAVTQDVETRRVDETDAP
jgi:hypothetical protein